MTVELGRIGVWAHSSQLDAAFAAEVEHAGYGAIWIGGSPPGDLRHAEELLAATERIAVATGIVNIWADDARTVAASHRRIAERFPGRFLLGIGVGHPEATSDYRHPYQALVDYLDVLDAEGVPTEERALAALGPRMLELAAHRSAGAHPYLVTPEHTRRARQQLGPGVLVAPEHKIVLQTEASAARAIGRPAVQNPYLQLTNYTGNLRRLGWSAADLADGGSDELIDALVGRGSPDEAVRAIREHLAAGADHVAIQLLSAPGDDRADGYRQLAAALA